LLVNSASIVPFHYHQPDSYEEFHHHQTYLLQPYYDDHYFHHEKYPSSLNSFYTATATSTTTLTVKSETTAHHHSECQSCVDDSCDSDEEEEGDGYNSDNNHQDEYCQVLNVDTAGIIQSQLSPQHQEQQHHHYEGIIQEIKHQPSHRSESATLSSPSSRVIRVRIHRRLSSAHSNPVMDTANNRNNNNSPLVPTELRTSAPPTAREVNAMSDSGVGTDHHGSNVNHGGNNMGYKPMETSEGGSFAQEDREMSEEHQMQQQHQEQQQQQQHFTDANTVGGGAAVTSEYLQGIMQEFQRLEGKLSTLLTEHSRVNRENEEVNLPKKNSEKCLFFFAMRE